MAFDPRLHPSMAFNQTERAGFDPAQHPRATDGKFAEKVGSSAEVELGGLDTAIDLSTIDYGTTVSVPAAIVDPNGVSDVLVVKDDTYAYCILTSRKLDNTGKDYIDFLETEYEASGPDSTTGNLLFSADYNGLSNTEDTLTYADIRLLVRESAVTGYDRDVESGVIAAKYQAWTERQAL